jgi:predicted nucleic acid-binding protein
MQRREYDDGGGCRDSRLSTSAPFGSYFSMHEVLPVIEDDGWQAARIVKARARAIGIGVADALIAAAAIREGLTLATQNLKDFTSIVGLKVIKPY